MSSSETENPQETLKIFDEFWNKLPVEIKRDIIKKLDIKTRANLRATSSNEKLFVDSTKMPVKSIKITFFKTSERVEVTFPTFWDFTLSTTSVPKAISLISFVLKIGIIDSLEIKENLPEEKRLEVLEELGKHAPLRIKQFRDKGIHENSLKFILERSEKSLKTIFLNESFKENAPPEDIINSVANAKVIRIIDVTNPDFLNELVQKWIDNDAEIGTTCQFTLLDIGILEKFDEKFKEDIVVKMEGEAIKCTYIKTKNEQKRVVMKQFTLGDFELKASECTVIATNAPVPEKEDLFWLEGLLPKYANVRDKQDTLLFKPAMDMLEDDINRYGDGWDEDFDEVEYDEYDSD